ncbi:MAG TPA: PLD nuclease N-terminal domain-containing protein [Ktedonobacteraceae bacterium]
MEERSSRKVTWLIFILLTHIVGAVIYFFAACTRQNPVDAFAYYYQYIRRAFQAETQATPRQQAQWSQPQSTPAPPPPYSNYQQGYQAQNQQPAPGSVPVVQEVPMEPDHPQPQYEQPLVSYPEMPEQ